MEVSYPLPDLGHPWLDYTRVLAARTSAHKTLQEIEGRIPKHNQDKESYDQELVIPIDSIFHGWYDLGEKVEARTRRILNGEDEARLATECCDLEHNTFQTLASSQSTVRWKFLAFCRLVDYPVSFGVGLFEEHEKDKELLVKSKIDFQEAIGIQNSIRDSCQQELNHIKVSFEKQIEEQRNSFARNELELKRENDTLQESFNLLRIQTDKERREIEAACHNHEIMSLTFQTRLKVEEEVSAKLRASGAAIKEHGTVVLSLKQENSHLKTEQRSIKAQMEMKKVKIKSLEEEIANAKMSNGQLQTELSEVRNELSRSSSEIASLKQILLAMRRPHLQINGLLARVDDVAVEDETGDENRNDAYSDIDHGEQDVVSDLGRDRLATLPCNRQHSSNRKRSSILRPERTPRPKAGAQEDPNKLIAKLSVQSQEKFRAQPDKYTMVREGRPHLRKKPIYNSLESHQLDETQD